MPNPQTTPPSLEQVSEEVASLRHHLYVALGSVGMLTGHIPNCLAISDCIKKSLSLLPKRGETSDGR